MPPVRWTIALAGPSTSTHCSLHPRCNRDFASGIHYIRKHSRERVTDDKVGGEVFIDGSFAFDASSGSSVGISSHGGCFTASGAGNAFTGEFNLTAISVSGDQISGNQIKQAGIVCGCRCFTITLFYMVNLWVSDIVGPEIGTK